MFTRVSRSPARKNRVKSKCQIKASLIETRLFYTQSARLSITGEAKSRPKSGVAGEVLFEKRREASLEPWNDLPPVAELEVFADGTGLAGLHAVLAL